MILGRYLTKRTAATALLLALAGYVILHVIDHAGLNPGMSRPFLYLMALLPAASFTLLILAIERRSRIRRLEKQCDGLEASLLISAINLATYADRLRNRQK